MNAYKLMVGQYGSTVGAKALRSRLRSADVQKAIERKRLKLQLEALKKRSVAEAYKSTSATQKAGLAPFYEDVLGVTLSAHAPAVIRRCPPRPSTPPEPLPQPAPPPRFSTPSDSYQQ